MTSPKNSSYICVPLRLPPVNPAIPDIAAEVAVATKRPLKLVNVVSGRYLSHPPTFGGIDTTTVVPDDVDKLREIAAEKLEKICLQLKRKHPRLRACSYDVLVGFEENEVLDLIEVERPQWTIISAREDSNFLSRLMGTTSSRVAKLSGSPVMVIPGNAEEFRPRHIAVFTDDDREDHSGLAAVADLARMYSATLEIIRVSESKTGVTLDQMERYQGELRALFRLKRLIYTLVEGGDLEKMIQDKVHGEEADMVVMYHHEQSILSKIMQGDHTQQVIRETELPLVVL